MNLAEIPVGFAPGTRTDGMPFADYLAIPALQSTGAKVLVNQSPAHYRHERANPQPPTPAKKFGSAVHLGVLEPDLFATHVIQAPRFNRRTKAGRAEHEAWMGEHAHLLAFDEDDMAAIYATVAAVRAHPAARMLLTNGDPEVTLQWVDASHGVPCKSRMDWWRDDLVIVDLKTTEDASPTGAQRAIERFMYHLSASHYWSGVEHVFGESPRGFAFIFAEKSPPHAVACYHIEPESLAAGRALMDRALLIFDECIRSGCWPAYSPGIEPINLRRFSH